MKDPSLAGGRSSSSLSERNGRQRQYLLQVINKAQQAEEGRQLLLARAKPPRARYLENKFTLEREAEQCHIRRLAADITQAEACAREGGGGASPRLRLQLAQTQQPQGDGVAGGGGSVGEGKSAMVERLHCEPREDEPSYVSGTAFLRRMYKRLDTVPRGATAAAANLPLLPRPHGNAATECSARSAQACPEPLLLLSSSDRGATAGRSALLRQKRQLLSSLQDVVTRQAALAAAATAEGDRSASSYRSGSVLSSSSSGGDGTAHVLSSRRARRAPSTCSSEASYATFTNRSGQDSYGRAARPPKVPPLPLTR